MTIQYSHTKREQYEHAYPLIKEAVDKAYSAARKVLEDTGIDCANDDRAENLVMAIFDYVTESADRS